jgi:hypothetical protein
MLGFFYFPMTSLFISFRTKTLPAQGTNRKTQRIGILEPRALRLVPLNKKKSIRPHAFSINK